MNRAAELLASTRVGWSAWLGVLVLLAECILYLLFARTAGERLLHLVMNPLHGLRLWVCNWQLRARAKFLRRLACLFESRFKLVCLFAQFLDFLYFVFVGHIDVVRKETPNDKSSATASTASVARKEGVQ